MNARTIGWTLAILGVTFASGWIVAKTTADSAPVLPPTDPGMMADVISQLTLDDEQRRRVDVVLERRARQADSIMQGQNSISTTRPTLGA